MTLKGKVFLNEQECTGNCDFSTVKSYMTAGFRDTFGTEAATIASTAVSLLIKTYPDNGRACRRILLYDSAQQYL